MTGNKRAVIFAVIVSGIAVIVVTAFVLRRPVTEEWCLSQLESDDDEERSAAIDRLVDMRSVRAVPRLISMLRAETEDPEHLGPAGSALAKIGPPALPLLLEACRDPDTYVGLTVASVLAAMGPAGLPGLFEALEGRDDSIRLFANIAFSRMGSPVVPTREALEHPDAFVRAAVIHLLAMQGQQSTALVPGLIAALQDEHHVVRAAAAEALGVIQPGAQEVVPALLTARMDESIAVRAAVAEAFGSTASAAAIPALVNALVDGDAAVRLAAVGSMTRLSSESAAQAALPALVSRLGDPDKRVQRAAAEAVAAFGLSTRGVTALLEQFLGGEPDDGPREAAARALRRIRDGANAPRRPR